jgi:DNA-directed RNA polymerase specialized sigma24 family protein
LQDPPPPRNKWALTPEAFDLLLSWLHPDREQAGLKYEEIRAKLIKRFKHLGCDEPEELANRTMDRVARILPEVIETYQGEPEPYFFSVDYYVYKEYLRKPIMQSLAAMSFREPATTDIEEMSEKELLDSCLKHCLDQMEPESSEMILEYYRGNRQVKIQARKALAKRMGITLAALRLRAQRARSTLKKCILDCMERKARERHY